LPDSHFVIELSKFFESKDIDVPIAVLGRQRVKVMNINDSPDEKENGVIDKWLECEPPERDLVAKILVSRELQELPVGNSPKQLLGHLPTFQARKRELSTPDFSAAARRIYIAFAQAPSWESRDWAPVEEVARRNEYEEPSLELIQFFLKNCRSRDDYPDILASGTIRWMRARKFNFFRLLPEELSNLDKVQKTSYEEMVESRVESLSEEEREGFEKWEEIIGRRKEEDRMSSIFRKISSIIFGRERNDR
jgi:hypothetical protein